jgi:hypothetical protein
VYSDCLTLLALGRIDGRSCAPTRPAAADSIEHLGAAAQDLRGAGRRGTSARRKRCFAGSTRCRPDPRSRQYSRPNENRAAERPRPAWTQLADARRGTIVRSRRRRQQRGVLGASTTDARPSAASSRRTRRSSNSSRPTRLLIFVARHDRLGWIEAPIGAFELAERVHLARELIAARDSASAAPLAQLGARVSPSSALASSPASTPC